ncbi:hypothetical protein [Pseudomonas petrae]|uniref:Uncharacterized protein n=1 Tax=Pseudomonas petrae TaxID=2912190 RepID=A0ABS9I267_9PSED|nr:hypothetical protein [Pseudomonas petrae]MCF7530802.1 hypothetical protein [Pseudomonas petrae]MCF7536475.1 hypothetical protein [Pseudomonas petrae]MCF7541276.1 hypothetical protein [Pseudomonas petrae]MCF7554154.1 hypothetical protein [Pseudomonas petrae]
MFWRVKDRIEDATWLSEQEKQVVLARMAKEAKPVVKQTVKDIWKHPTTCVMSGIYLCLVMALTGLLFWMPQLIKTAGVADTLNIGLLTVIPYLGAVIGNLLIGASSDRHGERRWHIALIVWGIPARYYTREVIRD